MSIIKIQQTRYPLSGGMQTQPAQTRVIEHDDLFPMPRLSSEVDPATALSDWSAAPEEGG